MNRMTIMSIILAFIVTLGGCAGMTETQQRTVSGSLIGAAGGGIIGAIAGNAGMGAAIGAGVGATGGFLYGKHKEGEQEAYQRGVADGRQAR
jgi:uncharacterized membrane protein